MKKEWFPWAIVLLLVVIVGILAVALGTTKMGNQNNVEPNNENIAEVQDSQETTTTDLTTTAATTTTTKATTTATTTVTTTTTVATTAKRLQPQLLRRLQKQPPRQRPKQRQLQLPQRHYRKQSNCL